MCNKTLLGGEAHGERNRSYDKELNLLDLGTADTVGTHKRRSVSPQRYGTWEVEAMRQAWTAHFLVTIAVLLCGTWHNNQRKYMSVDATNVPGHCARVFVDVFAESQEDEDAMICCSGVAHGLLGICDRTPGYLPFARRLSAFPEAWLLPIFPFLLRGIVRLLQGSQKSAHFTRSELTKSTTLKRLAMSFACLLFRGCILYSLFNFLEHLLVPTPDSDAPCWYKDFLKNFQTPCSGRTFDFSDHVVLYYGQLTAVALSETLYCLSFPFWKAENKLTPAILVGGLMYLYGVVLLGAYKTSAYYHTPVEIFVGLGVSFFLQIPLCLLQCSRSWQKVRSFLYGQRSSGHDAFLIQAK